MRTVVATGVSVNLGVFGMALTALDLGYQVVIPTDAVAGVPREYADAVLEHSLSLIATLTTTDELLASGRDLVRCGCRTPRPGSARPMETDVPPRTRLSPYLHRLDRVVAHSAAVGASRCWSSAPASRSS